MNRLSALAVALAACFPFLPPERARAADTAPLVVGKAVARDLRLDEAHVYEVTLRARQGMRGVVVQDGIDVVVRILDPKGEALLEMDSPTGAFGPERWDLEAKKSGKHRIEVRALGEVPDPGRYEIRLERILTPKEIAAEKAAVERRRTDTIEWLRTNAVPLAGVQPGMGFEDLSGVGRIIGDARVVALGEATHGTREFFQLKHRLLEYLVSEKGFTAFAIEATLPEAFDVDRYVLHGEGDAAKALAGLYFWTWNTEEVLDLIEWMRAWNADPSHLRKVRFYGFDMQSTTRAAKVALAALDEAASAEAKRLGARLAPVTAAYEASMLARRPAEVRADVLLAARELESELQSNEARVSKKRGSEEASRALRCARVLVQSLELESGDADERGTSRDHAMAENARWILDQEGPDGKIVLWAHNGHVSNTEGAMGHELRKAWGADLRVFGFAFYEGAFQAIDWPPPKSGLTTFLAPPALEGTLDAALAAADLHIAAVDLRALPSDGPVAEWFAEPHGIRSIGAVASPSIAALAYDKLPVRARYDALLFVRRTSAARAMPMAIMRRRATLMEASNLGFEEADEGTVPAHWRASRSQEAFGYRVEAASGERREGEWALRIVGLAGRRYGESYGAASQALDAAKYRGKRVRVSAWTRTEGSMRAHIAISGAVAPPGSSTSSEPVTFQGRRWTEIVAETQIPETSHTIAFEIGAEGVGTAWFDDVSFEVLDGAATEKN